MSIDAIAILPAVDVAASVVVEGGWQQGTLAGGEQILWHALDDGALVHLGVPIGYPDADLHAAAQRSVGKLPRRIWVFPDTAVPDLATSAAIVDATRSVGRWLKAGRQKKSLLEELGYSRKEAAAWQRDIASGDPARVDAAMAVLTKRVEGRDAAEVEALIAASLRR